MDDAQLVLPSAGPDPLPLGTALAAVVGYAQGRRPLYYRAANARTGRWVELPAYGYERFDRRPRSTGPLGEPDILTAEGLHGRLDREAWQATKTALADVGPLADAVAEAAAGRRLENLPDDEFSVLAEPGTVGAALRRLREATDRTASPKHVNAALHHRRPDLVPLLVRATRWQLLPHVREGDSGVEAVVHREVSGNAAAFARLAADLAERDIAMSAVRLHDVLLWLTATLRLDHAVALGQAEAHPGSRPV
ncbi:hypothetical protein [Blastococcus litoris]|uniref:hypothetical protein n=1 Tax=Blastococcus litoris TaxID=2171622 RepID=UPI001F12C18E|nr:hypothetical protein [Blastococcus litoris]